MSLKSHKQKHITKEHTAMYVNWNSFLLHVYGLYLSFELLAKLYTYIRI